MAVLDQAGVKVTQAGRHEADVRVVTVLFPGVIGEKDLHGEKKTGSCDPDVLGDK